MGDDDPIRVAGKPLINGFSSTSTTVMKATAIVPCHEIQPAVTYGVQTRKTLIFADRRTCSWACRIQKVRPTPMLTFSCNAKNQSATSKHYYNQVVIWTHWLRSRCHGLDRFPVFFWARSSWARPRGDRARTRSSKSRIWAEGNDYLRPSPQDQGGTGATETVSTSATPTVVQHSHKFSPFRPTLSLATGKLTHLH